MNMPDKGVPSNSQADDGDTLIDPDNFLWKQYTVYVECDTRSHDGSGSKKTDPG
jgi:hypothetical protein